MPYTESIPDAGRGIGRFRDLKPLDVTIPEDLAKKLPAGKTEALKRVLSMDPRPGYQDDPERVYGFPFAGVEVKFRVTEDRRAVVTSIE